VLDPSRSRTFEFDANWALYCDNYLEGFHIPFVHPTLNASIDFATYTTELLKASSVQIGDAKPGEIALEPPRDERANGRRDDGRRIAGYFAWLFPNLMLNFYPWGLSLNLVEPQGVSRTRVRFQAWVWDATKLERGAGRGLDAVELEDEAVVTSAQKGVRSRLYRRGRYSPARESGVHHFHRLLVAALA
jgi:choline monooxygenase